MKPNGSIRICSSYIGLNRYLQDVYYPLPRIEHIFTALAGNIKFSKLDLKDAHRQFKLDQEFNNFNAIWSKMQTFLLLEMHRTMVSRN